MKLGLCAAAEALGKPRKTLQRWKKRPDWPFSGAQLDLGELRSWAEARGLLERQKGRPPEVDRLADAAEVEPEGPRMAPVREVAATRRQTGGPELLADLSEADKAAIAAIVGDNPEDLLDLTAELDLRVLKRLAVVGRTRRELADAAHRELENRSKRGELVALEDVKRFWTAQIEIVKQHLQALPGKLAQRLADQKYDAIYKTLEDEFRSVLETFSVSVPAG